VLRGYGGRNIQICWRDRVADNEAGELADRAMSIPPKILLD